MCLRRGVRYALFMNKAIVLGCGRIGSALVRDLSADSMFQVAVADIDEKNLDAAFFTPNVIRIRRDLSDPSVLREVVSGFDVVLGALPSTLGFAALRAVIESGTNYVDISFMGEDPLQLDDLARQRGVTAVVDCGVAPGLANVIIGHCSTELDELDDVKYYVGGLPRVRNWPYQYRAPFAPQDVIEEYTRPARVVEDGQLVVKPALSEPELIDFPPVGTLEAFNTDGLRTMIQTIKARNMKEKTLRYPGHRDLMCVLRETGFFSKTEIEVRGRPVAPLDLTARLLFPLWKQEPSEQEFTILHIMVEGSTGSRRRRYTYDLYDEYDPGTSMTSMARTTGYPCVIVARMLAESSLRMPGVQPPELLGMQPGMLERILVALASRGVILNRKVEDL